MDLATAISRMEGWGISGSIASRNNNPGNLRYSPLQVGQEQTVNGKFATFATEAEGWQALNQYIASNSDMTLRDFIYKYAPPTENNSSNYLSYLSRQLGIGADSKIGELYDGSVDSTGVVGSGFDNLLYDTTGGIDNGVLAGVGLGLVVLLVIANG